MVYGLVMHQFVKVGFILSRYKISVDFFFTISAIVDCGSLPSPDNGRVLVFDSLVGNFADYFCDPGFILDGNFFRICLDNGSWSGSEPTCTGTCPL